MKAFNRTLFTVFILLPCLILGYQNCSELSSKDLIAGPNGIMESRSTAPKYVPIFINDLGMLEYSKPSDCSADVIGAMTLYSSTNNTCIEVTDSCQAYHFINEGYSEDQTGECDKVAHPDEEDFRASLKAATAENSGYKSKPGQICTMQFSKMINFNSRECANAANGCEISFYKSQGFVQDRFGICR